MPRKLREENGVRLPKRVWNVIDTARQGQKLCKFLRKKEDASTEVIFMFEPKGCRIATQSAIAAIRTPFLRAQGDGLFGDETSQTWVAA